MLPVVLPQVCRTSALLVVTSAD